MVSEVAQLPDCLAVEPDVLVGLDCAVWRYQPDGTSGST